MATIVCCAGPHSGRDMPVLRHRVITTFNAEAAGVTSDQIIRSLLEKLRPAEELNV